MSNMSYCRFENILRDLQNCEGALEEIDSGEEELSSSEKQAAKQLILLSTDIAVMHANLLYTL